MTGDPRHPSAVIVFATMLVAAVVTIAATAVAGWVTGRTPGQAAPPMATATAVATAVITATPPPAASPSPAAALTATAAAPRATAGATPAAPAAAAPSPTPAAAAAAATAAPASSGSGGRGRGFAYGVAIADANAGPGGSFDLAHQAGFTNALVVLNWANVERPDSRFAWDLGEANDLDNFLAAARTNGLRLVIRLDRPRTWTGSMSGFDANRMERFAAGVAARARGVATAYEVLNEPNLPDEWGGPPDPAGYVRLLQAAQRGVHSADPAAVVLSAGLSPYTGGRNGTMEDVDFLRAMYAAGAKGTFDAAGVHSYGGTGPPYQAPETCGMCFRRVELLRRVMGERDDADTPVWITEFGYLQTTPTSLGAYDWMKLAPQQQAEYLTGAFAYGYRNWPWLRSLVAFNLDFAAVPWNPPASAPYWFSLLNPDHTPRPAYLALRDMDKPGAAALVGR